VELRSGCADDSIVVILILMGGGGEGIAVGAAEGEEGGEHR